MKLFIATAAVLIILILCAILIARLKEKTNNDIYRPIYYAVICCIGWIGFICPLILLFLIRGVK